MRIRHDGQMWDVFLCDDGTMDTVIEVYDPKRDRSIESRFDCEWASYCRDRDGVMTRSGLRELAVDVIDDWEDE